MSSSESLPSDEVAIVFADVSGATTLFDTLGNAAAWEIVSRCLQLVMDEVKRFDGEVIKTIGDEVMCKFPTAEQAVRATKAMQERLLADGDVIGAGNNDVAVKMRIGFNYGPVLKQGNDVIGDAVNVAARMASSANPGQILTTVETIQQLPPSVLSMTRKLGRIPVKGKAEYIDAYEVVWGEEGDYTEVVPFATRIGAAKAPDLRITYGSTTLLLDENRGKLTMGRADEADLPVTDPGPGIKTSRTHATIERVRGRFVLTDLSANGTYVETSRESRRLERNQTMELSGTGKIGLGRPFDQGGEIISYESVLPAKD